MAKSATLPRRISNRWISLALTTPVVLWAGVPLYRSALQALRMGRIHLELPLTLAIFSAFGLSAVNTALERPYVYFDSVALLIFLLLISRLVQASAVRKAQRAARIGWSLLPCYVRRRDGEKVQTVRIEDIVPGDTVLVRAGERFPSDGIVESGISTVDMSLLTGEALPEEISSGSKVSAGTINVSGELVCAPRLVSQS